MCPKKIDEKELCDAINTEFVNYRDHLLIEMIKQQNYSSKAILIKEIEKKGYRGLDGHNNILVRDFYDKLKATVKPAGDQNFLNQTKGTLAQQQLLNKLEAVMTIGAQFSSKAKENPSKALNWLATTIANNSAEWNDLNTRRDGHRVKDASKDSSFNRFINKLLNILSLITANKLGKVEGRDTTNAIRKNLGIFDKQQKQSEKEKEDKDDDKEYKM
jgi:hypothetical protein